MVFPVAEITRALKAKGVHVMIDGAHALGQIDLDLPAIGADWYTANAHKWLYAPKGCAFLYAAADAPQPLPLSVSQHELVSARVRLCRHARRQCVSACGSRLYRQVRREIRNH
jgi:selenocysteine lyase/cysteine desulfurase